MNKLTLEDVEWSVFRLKEIFEVENCKCSKVFGLEKGMTPYVGATNQNNGTTSYLKKYDNLITKGNCMVFVCDGEGSMGYSYYKNEDFIGTTTIKVGRNRYLNKFNGLFISTVADTVRGKYNFGYKRNELRLKNETLSLPINKEGSPNWKFMEDYIKQEMREQSQKVITYYENKLMKLGFELLDLEVEWKEFKVKDIFKFRKKISKGLSNLEKDKNGINYLGATNRNNGVLEFVKDDENMRYKGTCIVFIRNGEGAMGYAVYKREDFIATQDISVGYNENLDLCVGTFLTTIADRVRGKYNFGYKRNQNRLENEILHLPIQNDGSPHWEYMRQFMKKLEKENMEKILNYLYFYNN